MAKKQTADEKEVAKLLKQLQAAFGNDWKSESKKKRKEAANEADRKFQTQLAKMLANATESSSPDTPKRKQTQTKIDPPVTKPENSLLTEAEIMPRESLILTETSKPTAQVISPSPKKEPKKKEKFPKKASSKSNSQPTPIVVEDPIVEDPVIEELVAEDLLVEEPVIEEPVVEEPVVEEPVVEDPVVEETVVEEHVIEEPVVEEPVVEDPVIEEPVVEDPVIEEPVVEDPVIEEPVVEDPVVEEPVVEEPQKPKVLVIELPERTTSLKNKQAVKKPVSIPEKNIVRDDVIVIPRPIPPQKKIPAPKPVQPIRIVPKQKPTIHQENDPDAIVIRPRRSDTAAPISIRPRSAELPKPIPKTNDAQPMNTPIKIGKEVRSTADQKAEDTPPTA